MNACLKRRGRARPDFAAYNLNGDANLNPDELGILIVMPQNGPFGDAR